MYKKKNKNLGIKVFILLVKRKTNSYSVGKYLFRTAFLIFFLYYFQ